MRINSKNQLSKRILKCALIIQFFGIASAFANSAAELAAKCNENSNSGLERFNQSLTSDVVALQKILSDASEDSCQLAVGQQITLDESNTASPTGVDRRYRLTRTSKTNFLVELRLEFLNDKKSPVNPAQDQSLEPPQDSRSSQEMPAKEEAILAENMGKHVEQCLTMSKDFLKGPDGASFTIKLNQTDTKVPLTQIGITSEPRSSSKLYNSNIDCASITHELLHLMGLNDEYREKSIGFFTEPLTGEAANDDLMQRYAYNCRPIGPIDSIMRDQHEAFKSALTKKTLLYPAQFRVITQPSCITSNRTYFSCAINSHRTSTQNGGQGCLASPDVCSIEGDQWLK